MTIRGKLDQDFKSSWQQDVQDAGEAGVNTFDWIEIRTHNLEGTANFYDAVFGWKIIRKEKANGWDVWIFDTQGEPRIQNLKRGGIWLRPDEETIGMMVYIAVDNIDAIHERVIANGGKVVMEKMGVAGGHTSLVADPSGIRFGLYEDR